MKKKKMLRPILISIILAPLGCFIYYVMFRIIIAALQPVFIPMEDNGVTAGFFSWGILAVESIYMILLFYYFHRETKGMMAGYLEGCMLLWLCGIAGYVIVSRQQRKISLVFIKNIKFITVFLIILALAAILYKIVPGKKNKGRNKKIFCALLSVPASLLAYGIYRFLHGAFWFVNVKLFLAPSLLKTNDSIVAILIEILNGCYFTVLLSNFHKRTKGLLAGYMEAGFLVWIPVLWNGIYKNEKWLLFLFLFILLMASIHNRKREEEAVWEKSIGLPFFLVISGYGIYYIAVICINMISLFQFKPALIATIIFSIYFAVIQRLSKGKLKWELLMAYGVFLSWTLLLYGICIAKGLDIEAAILEQKEYLVQPIKEMAPNLKMYFAYGISVLAGEAAAWKHHGGHGKKGREN